MEWWVAPGVGGSDKTRSTVRRLNHILALWLVLLVGGQSFASAAITVCRMSGAPTKGCPCPPAEGAPKTSDVHAALDAGPCCEVFEAESAPESSIRSAAGWDAQASRTQPPVPFVSARFLRGSEASESVPESRPRSPSRTIYLQLRQLLI